MATLAHRGATTSRGEARFFFILALAMSALIVGGFSLHLALGRSTFAVPWFYHVHALVFFGWVGLYLAQNALIFTGNRAVHRRLGWLAVPWVPMMLVMGITMTIQSLRLTGGPFFFAQNQFLFSNIIQLFGFAGLVAWAIAVRSDTGWHRRLMVCAMALLVGPGIGRLLPMPMVIPFAWYVSIFLPLVFPAIGMLADRRRHGRAHPAWLRGIAVVIVLQIVADLIAFSPIGLSTTQSLLEGTPGAERPMEAYLPPM